MSTTEVQGNRMPPNMQFFQAIAEVERGYHEIHSAMMRIAVEAMHMLDRADKVKFAKQQGVVAARYGERTRLDLRIALVAASEGKEFRAEVGQAFDEGAVL